MVQQTESYRAMRSSRKCVESEEDVHRVMLALGKHWLQVEPLPRDGFNGSTMHALATHSESSASPIRPLGTGSFVRTAMLGYHSTL